MLKLCLLLYLAYDAIAKFETPDADDTILHTKDVTDNRNKSSIVDLLSGLRPPLPGGPHPPRVRLPFTGGPPPPDLPRPPFPIGFGPHPQGAPLPPGWNKITFDCKYRNRTCTTDIALNLSSQALQVKMKNDAYDHFAIHLYSSSTTWYFSISWDESRGVYIWGCSPKAWSPWTKTPPNSNSERIWSLQKNSTHFIFTCANDLVFVMDFTAKGTGCAAKFAPEDMDKLVKIAFRGMTARGLAYWRIKIPGSIDTGNTSLQVLLKDQLEPTPANTIVPHESISQEPEIADRTAKVDKWVYPLPATGYTLLPLANTEATVPLESISETPEHADRTPKVIKRKHTTPAETTKTMISHYTEEKKRTEPKRIPRTDAFPTWKPETTEIPFEEQDHDDDPQTREILEDKPPSFELVVENKTVTTSWVPIFTKEIPYDLMVQKTKKKEKPQESILGYLLMGGYVGFAMDMESIKADKIDDKDYTPVRKSVNKNHVKKAIKEFQRFNGYPETGELTKNMYEYMAKPRCGTSDIEYNKYKYDPVCIKVRTEKKGTGVARFQGCQNKYKTQICKVAPQYGPVKYAEFVEGIGYHFELDLSLGRSQPQDHLAIAFNYNNETDTADFFLLKFDMDERKFVVDIGTYINGSISTIPTEITLPDRLRSDIMDEPFKIRFDIDDDGMAYFLIGNMDVHQFKYHQPIRSSAMIYVYDFYDYIGSYIDANISTFRLCKHVVPPPTDAPPEEEIGLTTGDPVPTLDEGILSRRKRSVSFWSWIDDVRSAVYGFFFGLGSPDGRKDLTTTSKNNDRGTRAKRYVLSVHKWVGEDIKYKFVNYSSILKQDGTRQAVLAAITEYSNHISKNFIEVSKDENADVTFMFITGLHADGDAFYGSGPVKAHAYSPVHGEVHFNDHDNFEIRVVTESKGTDLFYTALHEIGHALGIKHSEIGSAVMHATYDAENNQFNHDDLKALAYQYPGTKPGSIESLDDPNSVKVDKYWTYKPKLPLPRECHTQIDAALTFDDFFFLISNAFIWKFSYFVMDKPKVTTMEDGYPKRVVEVFPSWEQSTNAAFTASGIIYLLGEKDCFSYKYKNGFFVKKAQKSISEMFNLPSNIEPVLSAFSRPNNEIILVINATLQYKISWAKKSKKSKKSVSSEKIEDPTGLKLTGSAFGDMDFNAALSYDRYVTMENKSVSEVWRFAQSIAHSVKAFPTSSDPKLTKSSWIPIKDWFHIEGWCAT